MAIGPSGGMLKKMFGATPLKKKMKAALGSAKSGGPGITPRNNGGGRMGRERPSSREV